MKCRLCHEDYAVSKYDWICQSCGDSVENFITASPEVSQVQPLAPKLEEVENPQAVSCHQGMSLRDWFAGQAMQSYIQHLSCGGTESVSKHYDELAAESYKIACAMLAARSKTK